MDEPAPFQSTDPEVALCHQAINLYLTGHPVTAICRQVERSRTWFYLTLSRYQRGGREALARQYRAPHRVHNRTPVEVEQAVERVRRTILSGQEPALRYANLGADILRAELTRSGMSSPSRATANRILKRGHLTQPRRKPMSKK